MFCAPGPPGVDRVQAGIGARLHRRARPSANRLPELPPVDRTIAIQSLFLMSDLPVPAQPLPPGHGSRSSASPSITSPASSHATTAWVGLTLTWTADRSEE